MQPEILLGCMGRGLKQALVVLGLHLLRETSCGFTCVVLHFRPLGGLLRCCEAIRASNHVQEVRIVPPLGTPFDPLPPEVSSLA